jgi:hypothetical protein
LFEEEKIEAVNTAVNARDRQIAMDMIADGEDVAKIMKYCKLTRAEVEEVRELVGA